VGTCVVRATCDVPSTATNILLPTTRQSRSNSEFDLIARAKQGDEQAFAALFDTHKKRVYALCLRMTGDVADAEDLTQDAFIQVFRKLNAFRGDSAFSTWLYRVAVNTVLMKLRKRKTHEISLDEPIRMDSSLVQREYGSRDLHLSGTIDRIALIRAIGELPKGYRMIFLLHEVVGYGHQEIAQMLQCSIGNTKSQLHKARLKIREFLLAERSPDMARERSENRKPTDPRPGQRRPPLASEQICFGS
jgi:RNA polymerase sigma-70 factor, ECF subfamily